MKVLVCVFVLLAGALSAPNPDTRIVGGWDAQRGDHPYIVSVEYCILTACQHSCGGSIVAPEWVLTAAHCSTEVPLPTLGRHSVLAGILDLDDTNPERQLIRVDQILVHPDYAGGVAPHDLALFRLASPLQLNAFVQPIGLPPPDFGASGDVILIGWGSTGGIIIPQMPNRLQTVIKTIVPVRDCDQALTNILGGDEHPLDLDANVCTGPLTSGISACSGDSGGPLITVISGTPTVIGIVSWGITPCGTLGAPTVYTKTSHFVEWIHSVIGR